MVFVFLAEGFEEAEAVICIDLLRRAEIKVKTVSVSKSKEVKGAHGMILLADDIIDNISEIDKNDAILLPGGLPGVDNLLSSEKLELLAKKAHDDGLLLAAICAAPTILDKWDITRNAPMTCYSGYVTKFTNTNLKDENLINSNNVITAKALAQAIDFSLEIIKEIKGKDISEKVSSEIFYEND